MFLEKTSSVMEINFILCECVCVCVCLCGPVCIKTI